MRHREYVADRESRDPAFREACERLRPEYEFKRALIRARIAAGLTQRELAERIGTTQSAIARLESGGSLPAVTTLHRLASVLRIAFTIIPQELLAVRLLRVQGPRAKRTRLVAHELASRPAAKAGTDRRGGKAKRAPQ